MLSERLYYRQSLKSLRGVSIRQIRKTHRQLEASRQAIPSTRRIWAPSSVGEMESDKQALRGTKDGPAFGRGMRLWIFRADIPRGMSPLHAALEHHSRAWDEMRRCRLWDEPRLTLEDWKTTWLQKRKGKLSSKERVLA